MFDGERLGELATAVIDGDRSREAGVPEDVQFATKTELARAMLGRALDAGVPAAWVTATTSEDKPSTTRPAKSST